MDQAFDLSSWDDLDLLLGVLSVSGGSVTIAIETSMQNESEAGWVTLLTFTATSTSNTWEKKTGSTRPLKYIRWSVTGIGTDAIFQITGMLRSYQ